MSIREITILFMYTVVSSREILSGLSVPTSIIRHPFIQPWKVLVVRIREGLINRKQFNILIFLYFKKTKE